MGLDPRGLKDRYADYEEQMKLIPYYTVATALTIRRVTRVTAKNCWGLTASDGDKGYSAIVR